MNDRNIFKDSKNPEVIDITGSVVPCLGKNYITVCLSSSNEYVPFLSVVINSIMKNSNPDLAYEVVVLTKDISDNNKSILTNFVKQAQNFRLRFMNIAEYVSNKTFYTWAHFTAFTYYRLLIPELFAEYERVLYIDCDVIVNTDISALFQEDIEGYLLAAVPDTHVMGRTNSSNPAFDPSYYCDVLEVDKTVYFQAGVMLINVKEFLARFSAGELLDKSGKVQYRWLDQDFLNVECRGFVKYLPNAWNIMIINNPKQIDEMYLPDEYYADYIKGRRDPKIIHYVGRAIPCFIPHADMYQYYWPYARTSPYYELILSKMVSEAEKRMRRQQTLKQRIKAEWVMPVINKLLPPKTRRRKVLKKIYFKLRGWSLE